MKMSVLPIPHIVIKHTHTSTHTHTRARTRTLTHICTYFLIDVCYFFPLILISNYHYHFPPSRNEQSPPTPPPQASEIRQAPRSQSHARRPPAHSNVTPPAELSTGSIGWRRKGVCERREKKDGGGAEVKGRGGRAKGEGGRGNGRGRVSTRIVEVGLGS